MTEQEEREAAEFDPPKPTHKGRIGFPKEIRIQARHLHATGKSLYEISGILSVGEGTLETWRRKEGWNALQDRLNTEIIEYVAKTKAPKMAKIASLSLDLITMSLEARMAKAKLDENARDISIHEARQIAEIFTTLDKIIKLDTGQSTENIQHTSVSLEDLKKALVDDMFIDVVPIKAQVVEEKDK